MVAIEVMDMRRIRKRFSERSLRNVSMGRHKSPYIGEFQRLVGDQIRHIIFSVESQPHFPRTSAL
jgi:hypothetical protein